MVCVEVDRELPTQANFAEDGFPAASAPVIVLGYGSLPESGMPAALAVLRDAIAGARR